MESVLLTFALLSIMLAAWAGYRIARPPQWLGAIHVRRMRRVLLRDALSFIALAVVAVLAVVLIRGSN